MHGEDTSCTNNKLKPALSPCEFLQHESISDARGNERGRGTYQAQSPPAPSSRSLVEQIQHDLPVLLRGLVFLLLDFGLVLDLDARFGLDAATQPGILTLETGDLGT